jgi:hypothetical protein
VSKRDTYQVAPVPTAIDVIQAADGRGEPMILVRVSTPVGVACYFMLPAHAKALGEQLVQLGSLEKIIVPGGAA